MAKEKEEKTNVMRILEREKIPYRAYFYEHSEGAVDGKSVAEALHQDPGQVFKTLVTQGSSRDYHVFVIPVAEELNLKAAARSVGEKAVEMIPVKEINRVTGYVRGGCSPIGMKKGFSTVVDRSCEKYPAILFSAGKIGAQVEVAPGDLLRLTGGKTAAVTGTPAKE